MSSRAKDIGIVHSGSGRIIALRPVEVYSEDYALVEYGLAAEEMRRAEENILRKLKREKAKRWTEPPLAFAVEVGAGWGMLRQAPEGCGIGRNPAATQAASARASASRIFTPVWACAG